MKEVIQDKGKHISTLHVTVIFSWSVVFKNMSVSIDVEG